MNTLAVPSAAPFYEQISTPTAVYFPPGTYIVSQSLPIYFYT